MHNNNYIIKSKKGKLMKPTKMWQHKSCDQSLYHTLFIIGQFTVKQWQKTAAFRGTCRINLRKWKYQFTLESLPKPDNSKQLQNTALQAPIDGANIWMATWLYNIVQLLGSSILDQRNSRLDPCVLRLNPRISKLEAFEPWDARIKLRVSRFKCQFTFERYCKYNSV